MRIAVAPSEADAPLIVNSNAIRTRTIALQYLQLVSRRHAKILQPECPVQIQQLPPCGPFDRFKSPNPAVIDQRRGVGALKRPDQALVYDAAGIMSNVIARNHPHPAKAPDPS